jgi:hypothetical protein
LFLNFKSNVFVSGGMAEWLTRRTSNLMIAGRMGSNPLQGQVVVSLHLLPSTGWFQEWIRKNVYKLIASYTIEHCSILSQLYAIDFIEDIHDFVV